MQIEQIITTVELKQPVGKETGPYLDEAFLCLKDMESYPSFMEDVLRVKLKPLSANQSFVEWETKVEDAHFNWKQINTYDHEKREIRFEMVEGDFEKLEGKWKVGAENKKFLLSLDLRYAIGLPVIEEVLGPILNEKMQANSLSMLTSIKNKIGH